MAEQDLGSSLDLFITECPHTNDPMTLENTNVLAV